MTNPNTAAEYPTLRNIDNGCDTLRFLWALANKDFDLSHPGIGGIASRLTSFVEIERVPVFMQLAALKCWEEMNRNNQGAVPFPPLPTPGPDDVARAQKWNIKTGNNTSSSSSSSSTVSK